MAEKWDIQKQKIIAGILILSLGGFIYILYREHTLLYKLCNTLLCDCLSLIRQNTHRPTDFIIYNLPGGLWSTAYIFIIDGLFPHVNFRTIALRSCVIPMAGVASELLQAVHVLPGHYDSMDLILYLLPYLLFLGIRKICQTR
ncbi:MAG: hypothetical protein IJJ77_00355 [Paludibacteraceae bacterium]|nr:hypothetical protein [Paludibacteraceae bacterium]